MSRSQGTSVTAHRAPAGSRHWRAASRHRRRALLCAATVAAATALSAAAALPAAGQTVTARWASPVSGSFETPALWDTAVVPDNADPAYAGHAAVVIDASGPAYTVTIPFDSVHTIDSLTLNSASGTIDFQQWTGSFHVSDFTVHAGTLSFDGGLLADATLSSTAIGNRFGTGLGTLANVTAGTDLEIDGRYTVRGGLNLNGHTVTIGQSASGRGLLFRGEQTLQGPGTLRSGLSCDSGTLTISSQVTVDLGSDGSDVFGSGSAIVNLGTIVATGSSAGEVYLSRIDNRGLINISSSTVRLEDFAANTGIISLNHVDLTLAGTNTTDLLLSLQRSATHVSIEGTLDNTGRTLDLAPLGSMTLTGVIQGGTLKSTSPTSLTLRSLFQKGPSTLRDLAIDSPLQASVSDAHEFDLDNVTLNSSLSVTGPAVDVRLESLGSDSLVGSGELVFDSFGHRMMVGQRATIGPGVTVRTGKGDAKLDFSRGGVNAGTLRATTGRTLCLLPAPGFNHGTIQVDAGATLAVSGAWPIPDLGTVVRTPGGVIAYEGLVDNTGKTIDLTSPAFGPVELGGANITGGTITSPGRAADVIATPRIIPERFVPSLDGVTIAADLNFRAGAGFGVYNGLTLAGGSTLSLQGRSGLSMVGSQTLGGTGQIVFGTAAAGDAPGAVGPSDIGQVLTLGSGITVRTGLGSGNVGSVINLGTISAETPGQVLSISKLDNRGTVRAINGGMLSLTAPWTNTGTLSADAATVVVGGTSITAADIASIAFSNGATLVIAGPYDNAGGTLVVRDAARTLTFAGATVNGGRVASPTGDTLKLESVTGLSTNNVFTGVTVDAPIDARPGTATGFSGSTINAPITADKANVILSGAWTNNASVSVSNGGILYLMGSPNSLGSLHVSGGTVSVGIPSNRATLDAIDVTNSTIVLTNRYDNTGQMLFVDLGTNRIIVGGTLKGGTLASNDPAKGMTFGAGTLDGVTLATEVSQVGPFNFPAPVQVRNGLTLSGGTTYSFATPGRLPFPGFPLPADGSLLFSGTQTLGGSGQLVFDVATNYTDPKPPAIVALSSGTTLTVGPDVTIRTGAGGGMIGTAGATIVNSGTILSQAATAANSLPEIRIDGTFSNLGTLRATGGGRVALTSGAKLSNLNGVGTLSGGTFVVDDNSTIDFGAARTIATNAATIRLTGVGSKFDALAPLKSNTGQLALLGGRNFTTPGDLSNAGELTVGAGSTMTVTGNFTQAAGGKLKAEVGGAPGARVSVTASARLGGTLALSTPAGFSPSAGDAFRILSAGSRGGTFATVGGVSLGPDLSFAVTYQPDGVTATAALPGDIDLDKSVGPGDFNLLATHFGAAGQTWSTGDLDGDGIVGPGDFNPCSPPTSGARQRAAAFSSRPPTARRSKRLPRRACPSRLVSSWLRWRSPASADGVAGDALDLPRASCSSTAPIP